MTYVFDTSAFMETWNNLYPPDTFSDLWERIDGLIDDGRIISPDEVEKEMARKDDALKSWAKARQQAFVKLDGARRSPTNILACSTKSPARTGRIPSSWRLHWIDTQRWSPRRSRGAISTRRAFRTSVSGRR